MAVRETSGNEAQSLLNVVPDAIFTVDEDGRIILANTAAARLFGYLDSELPGQPLEGLLPSISPYLNPRRRHGSTAIALDLAGRRRDASTFSAELSLLALPGHNGTTVAVRDVSRRRMVSDEQVWLAAAVRSTPDAFIGLTPDGMIVSCNPGVTTLLGYSPDELIGHPASVLWPAERREMEEQMLRRVTSGEQVPRYDSERMRADGGVVTVSVSASPIVDSSGAAVGSVSICRDSGGSVDEAALRDVTDLWAAESDSHLFDGEPHPERLHRRSGWRASASSPAASPTTSTTCSR